MPCPNANDKRKKMPGGINYNPLKSFNMFSQRKKALSKIQIGLGLGLALGLTNAQKTKVSRRGRAAVGGAVQKPRQIA